MPQDKIEDLGVFYDNLKITEGLVELAKILKPKKLINFSSIAVYPNVDGKYSETSPIRPSVNTECLYGLSKFCSENIIDFMLRKENMIIAHLRSSQVYGEGSRSDRIIPLMLEELKRKNVITVFGSGERVSNFIHVDKLTEIVELFIKKDIKGIFNIGDEQLSYLELARRLIKEYGNKDSRIIKERRGSRAKVYIDIGKLKKVLQ
jgi:nucleoside-diphosphate-sugar epimerase